MEALWLERGHLGRGGIYAESLSDILLKVERTPRKVFLIWGGVITPQVA